MKRTSIVVICLAFMSSSVYSGVTTEVICSYAPSQSATVNRISSLVAGAGVGSDIALSFAGLTSVSHSSGASIFTGVGGYIAGTMPGAIASTALVTASILVAGTVVTYELACAPKNHPELVKKVMDGAQEYGNFGTGKFQDLFDVGRKYRLVIEDKFYELIGETWYERLLRKTKTGLGLS